MRFILLIATCFFPAIADAQLFGRYSRSGYQTTPDGYNYQGKRYTLGVDGPVSASCNCPMCQRLRAALQPAMNEYHPVPNQQPIIEYYSQPVIQQNGPVVRISERKTEIQQSMPVEISTAFDPTPMDAVNAMIKLVEVKKDGLVVDAGCGDARILIEAVKKFGCRGAGIEINPDTVSLARTKVSDAGLSNRIMVTEGDVTTFAFVNADVVVVFLYPSLLEKLERSLLTMKTGSQIISYSHEIPNSVKHIIDGHVFYVRTN